MTPTRKFCHWKGIQEITSLADSTLMMYLSPHVNKDCIAKLRDILKSDLKLPIVRKKRDLRKNIRVPDDLIWEDSEKKKQLEFIVNALELGRRLSTW